VIHAGYATGFLFESLPVETNTGIPFVFKVEIKVRIVLSAPDTPPNEAVLVDAGEHVFVEVANQEVKVFHIENSLPQTGVFPLDGNPLAGNPLALSDGFLAVRRDGMLIKLDATAATTLGSRSLGQLVQQGPLVINGQTLVVGYDGSLYQIDASSL
jgi:outer membrane protein assembly factor BamB